MTDNLLNFKKRMRPEDYENGPVKIFNQEQIDEWSAKNYDGIAEIISHQQGLSESDLRYLDSMKLVQAEMQYNELMEGTQEQQASGSGE